MSQKKILCVCLGNICRSPLAEGVLRSEIIKKNLQSKLFVDSCGTCSYHVGQSPHSGGVSCAKEHNIDISKHHARQIKTEDFANFDLILAMDSENMSDIRSEEKRCKNPKSEIKLLSDFLPPNSGYGKDVPDCYYARDQHQCFEEVYQMILAASGPIIDSLTK